MIDYDRTAWFEGLWGHYTPREFIKRELEQAGYELQNDFDFLERQSFLNLRAQVGQRNTSPGHSHRPSTACQHI